MTRSAFRSANPKPHNWPCRFDTLDSITGDLTRTNPSNTLNTEEIHYAAASDGAILDSSVLML